MKLNCIKKNIRSSGIEIKIPYKSKFSILRANKIYFPQLKEDKKTKYVNQQLFLNIPQFVMSDNNFLQIIALKFNNRIFISTEEMSTIQTDVKIVSDYDLIKLLNNYKEQKLGIMNIEKYEEILENLKQNMSNRFCFEYINDNDNIIDEQILVTKLENNQTIVESINIKYIFPGEYIMENKKVLFNEYNIKHIEQIKQKVKVR